MSNGRCDAYRCGLGGAESENVHAIRARSKIKTGLRTPTGLAAERAGAVFRSLWRHFAPFGSIWGSLGGYFVYMGSSLERFWCVFEKYLFFQ